MKKNSQNIRKSPPDNSNGLFSDISKFLITKPKHATLIKFDSEEDRNNYNIRITQRIGIDPNRYSVLNIHKIGINAPVSHIFNELLQWSGDSSCWPNHIAKVDRIENNLENIQILPFGWKKYPFKFMKSIMGLKIIPLFLLKAIRIKKTPDAFDFDNARYLLFECSGGYPIGIYAMYIRSSIAEMNEKGQSQLFLVVGFNFYGKQDWQKGKKIINVIWEKIHNRVSANVLNRLKQLSEWRIENMERNEPK